VLGVGGGDEVGLEPEVGGQVSVGVSEGLEHGFAEVLDGPGLSLGGGVAIIDSGELDQLLGDGRSDDSSSSGCGNESHAHGSALSSHFARDGMDVSDLVSPVSSSDGDEVELGINEGSLDGDLDFLGEFNSETDVSVKISNGNDCLKSSSLSSLGLLLD